MFHIFHFLQSDMGFGIKKTVSSPKSCPSAMPFLIQLIYIKGSTVSPVF